MTAQAGGGTARMLLAGFGGQGILFAGKFLSYIGLTAGREVSWLPSYGPEMRGGTANCSVILSDAKIGSPIVDRPDVLVCMNLPSLDRFEGDAAPGALVGYDRSLIARDVRRGDVRAFAVPATQIASDSGFIKLANMVLIGTVLRETGLCDPDGAKAVLEKMMPTGKAALLAANLQALAAGYAFDG